MGNMLTEIAEVCPHCDYENNIVWDVEEQGYVITCKGCGKKMMLCSMCGHYDENTETWETDICDQHVKGNTCFCHRGKYKGV